MDEEANGAGASEAAFRREAAHALSTPLGSLLLQAELIEHYLGQYKLPQAREAVSALLKDFDAFGRRFREVFSAMSDIAEDGAGASDPQGCLAAALAELGQDALDVGYSGVSRRVAVPALALTALLRRLASVAMGSGGREATITGSEDGGACRLSLIVEGAPHRGVPDPSFDSPQGLDLRVASLIAVRHGGTLETTGAPGGSVTIVVTLPLADPNT